MTKNSFWTLSILILILPSTIALSLGLIACVVVKIGMNCVYLMWVCRIAAKYKNTVIVHKFDAIWRQIWCLRILNQCSYTFSIICILRAMTAHMHEYCNKECIISGQAFYSLLSASRVTHTHWAFKCKIDQ